jgi:hypothetical protein
MSRSTISQRLAILKTWRLSNSLVLEWVPRDMDRMRHTGRPTLSSVGNAAPSGWNLNSFKALPTPEEAITKRH